MEVPTTSFLAIAKVHLFLVKEAQCFPKEPTVPHLILSVINTLHAQKDFTCIIEIINVLALMRN